MKTVIFIKDFANRKKDDEFTCDSMLASRLVHKDKVAKYKTAAKKKTVKKKEQ
jgi:hypothetical protein